MDADDYAQKIRRCTAEMLSNMAGIRDDLREVQARVTPKQFKHWTFGHFGMDEATVQDILAFDRTMGGMTERMWRWVDNTATRGRTS